MPRIKVLAIDDEPYLLDLTKIFLETDPNIIVDLAGSGREALSKVVSDFYDCLISDYQMPGMDGLELLKALRTQGWDVPFILFTGKGREDVAVSALNHGASFYLQKGGGVEAQFIELANMVKRSAEIYRSKRELEESENRFRILLQHSSDFILIIDPKGTVNYCSSSTKRITGYTEEELLGKNVYSFVHPDDVEEIEHRIELVKNKGNDGSTVEFRLRSANGEHSPMACMGANMIDVPSVNGLVITVSPISERKKAERAIKEGEEAYKTLFEKSPFPISLSSMDGTFVDVNEKFLQLSGGNKGEIIGKGAVDLDFIEPQNFAMITEMTLDSDGIIDQYPIEIKMAGGGRMRALLSARTIHYHGEPHILSVLNDVSELVVAKNALQLKNEELHEERDRMQKIADQIPGVVYQLFLKDEVQKFIFVGKGAEVFVDVPTEMWLKDASWLFNRILPEDRGHFLEAMHTAAEAGTMCRHEFRLKDNDGSIRWIMNTSSMTHEKDGGSVWTGAMTDITERKRSEEAVKQVNRQLTLMTSMTRHDCLNKIVATEGYIDLASRMAGDERMIDLLDKAQGSIEAIRSEIDLTRELQEISNNEARWVKLKDIVHELVGIRPVRVPDVCHQIEVFSSPMLRQVFMNLLDNSIRHGVHVTDTWMDFNETESGLVVSFNDNGMGISDEEKERIFDRGYGRNSGLGLFLAKEVLKITNITIRENGTWGQGARFELEVPRGYYRFMEETGANEGPCHQKPGSIITMMRHAF